MPAKLRLKQPVQFVNDLTFGAQVVPQGTRAYVVQLSTIPNGPIWVNVPSIRRDVLVPQSEVRPVVASSAAVMNGTGPKPAGAVCRFADTAPVRLRSDRHYGNDLVLAGTAGKITQVISLTVACLYWVRWQPMTQDVLVPESDLV